MKKYKTDDGNYSYEHVYNFNDDENENVVIWLVYTDLQTMTYKPNYYMDENRNIRNYLNSLVEYNKAYIKIKL